jgi:plastocyanin
MNNGASWTPVVANARASSPGDTERGSYSFSQPGSATFRATATDTGGLQAASEQAVAVGKASQTGVTISPAAVAIAAGQSVAFSAAGGATGNYAWGGAAAGSGATETVPFATAGSYSVTVMDTGNADYNPSGWATATVTVQPAFYTLSVTASSGGSATGGGSYPPNSEATAVATPGPGAMFSAWTGDISAGGPSVSILMNSKKSIMAHFAALLAQTITLVPPGAVTTRTPAFAIVATASSGLPVSLALNSGPASLSGSVVTPAGAAGEVTLTATQAGNSQYLPAAPVSISFPIGPSTPGVFFADDSSATKRSDKETRVTSYTSGPAQ